MENQNLEKILLKLCEIENLCRGIQHFYKDILTIDEAANYTGLQKSYLYKLCSERKIPHYKNSGKMLRFKKEELAEFQLRNRVSTIKELDLELYKYMK
ncbi:MAG: helix-turn-helix domain-containing protein [Crocinitomicaceae bacterium]|nr:helix-turn-helix domain-containing protein [Crocinitomicaceae bacterium]